MGDRLVRVRVKPGARKESFIEESDNVLTIAVKEKAERGEANERVRELVARYCGVSVTRVRLQRGRTAHTKTFMITT